MKHPLPIALALAGIAAVSSPAAHLLITELRVTPSAGEFIEIYNPGSAPVALDNVYLSDATYANNSVYYYNTPTGDKTKFGGGANNDFTARFPAGASIAAGQYITVALAGSTNFYGTYGKYPDYEMFEDGSGADAIPDMLEAASGSIHKGTTAGSFTNGSGLTNGGEIVVLYSWDQVSPTVVDLDYVLWGNTTYGVSKNGIAGYNAETALASQKFITPAAHAADNSWQRATLSESNETVTGGNGIEGHDEMSEDLATAFVEAIPSPGGAYGTETLPYAGIKKIAEIQGTTDVSPYANKRITTSGVVYANFIGTGKLQGFFMQDIAGDSDPLTSEGVFVYCPNCAYSYTLGDSVTVMATAVEYNGLTELKNVTGLVVEKSGLSVPVTQVALPVADTTVWERYEGMQVGFANPLTLTESYQLGRYGQLLMTAGERFVQPSQTIDPSGNSAAISAAALAHKLRSVIVDDASTTENPNPNPYYSAGATLRLGSKASVVGALNYRSGAYRVEFTDFTVTDAASRPALPTTAESYNLTAVSFNMLNYFTTLNANGATLANGLAPRGANTAAELARQQAKLVAAVQNINADIVNLEEVENSGDAAVAAFVAALNAVMGEGTYALVKDPAVMGTDAIKIGMLYKPAKVLPVGRAKVVNASGYGRPSLVQTFRLLSNNGLITVIGNHLKSKGCATGMAASDPDADQNDGQSCYNATRIKQALVLADFVDNYKKQTGSQNILLLGDFNSYNQEDPIDTLRARGFQVLNENDTTYVYDGQLGQLDYAMASAELAPHVKLAKAWQINSAEPTLNDYDETYNPSAYYTADEFRSSDHDPVVVRINLPSNASAFSMTLLHNNDAESFILNSGNANFGGVARFKTVLDSARSRNLANGRQVLTLSSADNFIPGPEMDASLQLASSADIYDAQVFAALGYDASGLGNHDFDLGPDFLARFIADVPAVPFLSANLDVSAEASLAALATSGRIAPFQVLERGGEKIALIGATTTELAMLSSPGKVKALDNIESVVQHLVDSLSAAGVNKIILISHLQAIANDTLLAKKLRGVDLIIAGGGHELLANVGDSLVAGDKIVLPYPVVIANADGKPTPIVTTAGSYKYVGELALEFDAQGDLLYFGGAPLRVAANSLYGGVVANADLLANVETPVAAHLQAMTSEVVGATAVPLSGVRTAVRTQETNFGNLIADAHLWQAREVAAQFGVQKLPTVAFQNGGGIRNNDVIPVGDITRMRTYKALPFVNFLGVQEEVTPDQFKEIMENAVSAVEKVDGRFAQIAGFRMVYDPAAQPRLVSNGVVTQEGKRVLSIILDDGTAIVMNGQVVVDAPSVSMATIDFLAKGGDGFPMDIAKLKLLGTYSYQMSLENYIRHLGTVSAEMYPEGGEGRIQTPWEIAVLHNNDGESALLNAGTGKENFGGVHRFKSLVDSVRARNLADSRPSLLVSSGDNFLAGPEFNTSLQLPAEQDMYDAIALAAMGYDAICLGNHDFDFGPDVLERVIRDVPGVPFLSANLDVSAEPGFVALQNEGRLAPLTVVEKKGEKVAIIGATTPQLPYISSPRLIVARDSVRATVQHLVDSLENAGINKILLISHLQSIAEDTTLGKTLHGIDAMVAGGGDDLLANPTDLLLPGDVAAFGYPVTIVNADGKQVPIVTTAGSYKYLGELQLQFDHAGNLVGWGGHTHRVAAATETDGVEDNAALLNSVVTPISAALADMAAQQIAVTDVPLSGVRNQVRTQETNLGNLVADAHLWQARQLASAFGIQKLPQVAFQNGGGIRNDDTVKVGPITLLQTFKILPFANFITVQEEVPAAQFKQVMEHALAAVEIKGGQFAQIAGFKVVYDPTALARIVQGGVETQAGARVVSITLDDGTKIVENGKVVEGAPSVSLATIDFLARGGDGYPFELAKAVSLGVTYQKSLENYLANGLSGVVGATEYPLAGSGRITVGKILDPEDPIDPEDPVLVLDAKQGSADFSVQGRVLHIQSQTGLPVRLRLGDALGRNLFDRTVVSGSRLDLSALPAGNYHVRLQNDTPVALPLR